MKFTNFKEFRQKIGSVDYASIAEYLTNEMNQFLRELNVGLTKLSFSDNFNSFTVSVTIAAGQELAIRNQLKNGLIPNYRIILRGGSGAQNVVDGPTAWSSSFVYLKNEGGSSVDVTVLFMR